MNRKVYQNKYVANFGVEIHVELLTNTKAFSPAKVDLASNNPNLNVNQIDIGYPGAKPTVNKKMVNLAYRSAKVLEMEIDTLLRFDRKNYYYPDLPKGFQITQFYHPFGKNGHLKIIKDDGTEKDIFIKQLHIEEDTAKQIKKGNDIYFDFNRSGVPLIEIVSGHKDIFDIKELVTYIKQLREQLMFLKVNSGKLFEGAFRVDLNVSIRNKTAKELGTRVEIKNLNSFHNIELALEYEINQQIKTLESGKKVKQVTKRFDETTNRTVLMREKDTQLDYNFIPEGNIIPIELNTQTLTEFNSYPILKTADLRRKLLNDGLTDQQITIILQYSSLYMIYNNLSSLFPKKKLASFLTTFFYPITTDEKINLQEYEIPLAKLKKLIEMLFNNKITTSEAKELIIKLVNNQNVTTALEKFQSRTTISQKDLISLINSIINSNVELMHEYPDRPERVSKFIMGQVMKTTKGQVNPKLANETIQTLLKKYE